MPMIGLDFGFIYQPILSRAMQKIKHHTVCDCEDMLGSLLSMMIMIIGI